MGSAHGKPYSVYIVDVYRCHLVQSIVLGRFLITIDLTAHFHVLLVARNVRIGTFVVFETRIICRNHRQTAPTTTPHFVHKTHSNR
jgi:hypothetical protein